MGYKLSEILAKQNKNNNSTSQSNTKIKKEIK